MIEIKENLARIVKIATKNTTIYIVEGSLMKQLLENELASKQAIFTPVLLSTEDFVQEFKEKFNLKGD